MAAIANLPQLTHKKNGSSSVIFKANVLRIGVVIAEHYPQRIFRMLQSHILT